MYLSLTESDRLEVVRFNFRFVNQNTIFGWLYYALVGGMRGQEKLKLEWMNDVLVNDSSRKNILIAANAVKNLI